MNNDNAPGRAATNGPSRRQFFDVVRPGATPASPTSRPIIAQTEISDPNVAMSGVGEAARLRQARQTPSQPTQPSPTDDLAGGQLQPASMPATSSRPVVVSSSQPKENILPSNNDPLPAEADPLVPVQPHMQIPSHYSNKKGIISEILAIFAIVLLLVVIVNILLDAEVINLPLPHTNFFDY